MGPLSELIRRIHRVVVLLVVIGYSHAGATILERVCRHTFIDIFVDDSDVAGKLDVIVLQYISYKCCNSGLNNNLQQTRQSRHRRCRVLLLLRWHGAVAQVRICP